ncbi:extracellular solute-binding protein [Streptomyces boninensis]|uniref:extracellular solute-binding protein n=1 Tax=Streptomyces boninensis TaxID=2039455 RepID=UPI003B20F70E
MHHEDRDPAPPPPRRTVLRAAAAGLGAVALGGAAAGCGAVAGAASEPGTLRYWNLFAGGAGGLMKQMTAEAVKKTPGATVEATVLEWGPPYYTKLSMAAAGGRGPEVAAMHLSRLAGYAPGGLLEPWDTGLLAEYGVAEHDFDPSIWRRGHYSGKLYALPLDTHPSIVYFDRKKMDQAGLLDADGRLTGFDSPDAFLDSAAKLKKRFGVGPVYGHTNDDAQAWRLFWALYGQSGAPFDLSGKKVDLDRDTAVRVVDFMVKLVRPDSRTYDPPTAVAQFAGRRTPMILSGEWELQTFGTVKGLALDGAPFPGVFGKSRSYADSHSLVLPRQGKPDERRRRLTHRWAAELLKASLTWAKAGHIPAYRPITATKAYRELVPQAHYAAAGEEPLLDPAAWFTGAGSEFQRQMCEALQTAMVDGDKPERAVDRLTDRLNAMLAKPNPIAGS